MSYYGKTYFLEKQVAQVWLDTTELANRLFITAIGTISSSFEHVDGISVCVSAHVNGPKRPGKYGHRETPILRHAFFIAVAEMPSLNAAIGSERLTNCSRISTVIETGTRVWPSILRLGITVQTVSGVPVVNITFTNNERFKV